MIHIVSDLKLNLHERAEDQENLKNNVNYIIIAGNVADTNKRSILYAERLAKLYPNTYIIFNYGLLESYQGEWSKIVEGYELYINEFKKSSKNVFLPHGEIIGKFDFYCTVGWPTFYDDRDFLNSYIGSQPLLAFDQKFYIDNILMTSKYPRALSLEFIREQARIEEQNVYNWIKNDRGVKKILVSSFGNGSQSYMAKMNFKIFPNLNLQDVTWICGGDSESIILNNQQRVLSLPGRNRNKYIDNTTFQLIFTDT